MRVVFMGSPEFAVPSLRELAARHQVVGVYTQPDRPRRRGREPLPTPVKSAALELGLHVFQPGTLRDPEALAGLASLVPDVVCVAAYGLILPPAVLDVPRFGCVNVHASLLPRHRGAAPVHRAILEGDEVTGVSIMRMEQGLDTGPVARTVVRLVDDLDVETLTALLAEDGATALLGVLDEIEHDTVSWVPQDDSEATYAAKVTDADVALDPSLTVSESLRRVRASGPSARSKVRVEGRLLDVLQASPASVDLAPGAARAEADGLLLGVADGSVLLEAVRPEGRSSMTGASFACGARLDADCRWSPA